MTVFVYFNTSKQVGDPEHIKVFTSTDAAETWFEENDPQCQLWPTVATYGGMLTWAGDVWLSANIHPMVNQPPSAMTFDRLGHAAEVRGIPTHRPARDTGFLNTARTRTMSLKKKGGYRTSIKGAAD
jgi:hypothetical protein